MTDTLSAADVERLALFHDQFAIAVDDAGMAYPARPASHERTATTLRALAAERDAQAKRIGELENALAWYRGNVSLCNNFRREGAEARDRLAKDAGNRAENALKGTVND